MADNQFFNSMSVTTYVVLITTSVLLVKYWIKRKRENEKMAKTGGRPLPGPWGLPVIGSLLSLDQNRPQLTLVKLAKVYGNVYKIQFGSKPVLVLNGHEAIKKALINQPAVFAGRPDMFTFQVIKSSNIYGPSVAFNTYNDQLKLQRKIIEKSFRHFTQGSQVRFLESVVKGEAEELVRHLSVSTLKGEVDIKRLLRLSVTNLILWYMFGKRSSYDDKRLNEILHLTDNFEKPKGSGSPVDFMPWLRFFATKSTNQLKEYRKKSGEILSRFVEEHHAAYESGSERDLMAHLITVSHSSEEEELRRLGLTGKALYQSAFDFFPAGTDTVLATLEWIMVYMTAHPQAQSDVQAEIDEVVGRDRLPTLNDRVGLPLTQSCLLEIQRHASAVPFAVPHSTMEDTVLMGKYVPKDMLVFVNLYTAHFDPDVFHQPEIFNPRRFLTQDGKLDEEKTKLAIPFSLGPRRCVGIDLAPIKLFIYFAAFLHQLNFRCPDGQSASLESDSGFPRRPKVLNVQICPRSKS